MRIQLGLKPTRFFRSEHPDLSWSNRSVRYCLCLVTTAGVIHYFSPSSFLRIGSPGLNLGKLWLHSAIEESSAAIEPLCQSTLWSTAGRWPFGDCHQLWSLKQSKGWYDLLCGQHKTNQRIRVSLLCGGETFFLLHISLHLFRSAPDMDMPIFLHCWTDRSLLCTLLHHSSLSHHHFLHFRTFWAQLCIVCLGLLL